MSARLREFAWRVALVVAMAALALVAIALLGGCDLLLLFLARGAGA